MSDPCADTQEAVSQKIGKSEWIRTLARCSRYLAIRSIVVFVTVLVGIYAAIWVTNLGGYADEQRKLGIEHNVTLGLMLSGTLATLSTSERHVVFQKAFEAAYIASDLDRPFVIRSFGYFRDAFTLSLGNARLLKSRSGSREVLDILKDKLPMTLLLFGVANTLTFFGGLFIALALSRRYGGFLDRAATLLVPAFAAPPWFHGIFLILIFASLAKVLPFGGMVGVPLPETTFGYLLSVLKHMILPVSACVLGAMPLAVYTNRSLFMIHSSEDYVELAKAKGLRSSRLQSRYILRPVLPPIITNFAFVSLVAWQGVILTEHVFSWPGLGALLIKAIESHEVSVVIGAVTIFAYLLGLGVLVLDMLYVLVDPRVTLGAGGRK